MVGSGPDQPDCVRRPCVAFLRPQLHTMLRPCMASEDWAAREGLATSFLLALPDGTTWPVFGHQLQELLGGSSNSNDITPDREMNQEQPWPTVSTQFHFLREAFESTQLRHTHTNNRSWQDLEKSRQELARTRTRMGENEDTYGTAFDRRCSRVLSNFRGWNVACGPGRREVERTVDKVRNREHTTACWHAGLLGACRRYNHVHGSQSIRIACCMQMAAVDRAKAHAHSFIHSYIYLGRIAEKQRWMLIKAKLLTELPEKRKKKRERREGTKKKRQKKT